MRLPSRWVTNPAGSNPNRKERTLREFALFVFPPYTKRSLHSRLPPPTALHGAACSQKGRPPRCPRLRYGLPHPVTAHTTQKQNLPVAALTAGDKHPIPHPQDRTSPLPRPRHKTDTAPDGTSHKIWVTPKGNAQLERDRIPHRLPPPLQAPKEAETDGEDAEKESSDTVQKRVCGMLRPRMEGLKLPKLLHSTPSGHQYRYFNLLIHIA